MPYKCELDGNDISTYFGVISTEQLMASREKQNILQVYAHLLECLNCMNYYTGIREEVEKRTEPIIYRGVCLDFELLLQNEKILETLFRN